MLRPGDGHLVGDRRHDEARFVAGRLAVRMAGCLVGGIIDTDRTGRDGPSSTTRPATDLDPRRLPAVYPIVRSRRGFATVIVVDLVLGDTGRAQPRQERVGQVGVAVAAEGLELRVAADVLAEEQAISVPTAEELAHQLDDARLPDAVRVPRASR